jgi:hypothetical protein
LKEDNAQLVTEETPSSSFRSGIVDVVEDAFVAALKTYTLPDKHTTTVMGGASLPPEP